MNKYLMTALCALGVAGAAMAGPRPAGHDRGHHDSPTKTFQREMSHVGAGLLDHLGHAVIDAVVGTPTTVVTPVATVVTPTPAPAVVVTPTPAPAVVVTPPPAPAVVVTPPPPRRPRTQSARPLTHRAPPTRGGR